MNHGKFFGPKTGKNSQKGMFTGGWIDINTVAGDPCKNLGFGGHKERT